MLLVNSVLLQLAACGSVLVLLVLVLHMYPSDSISTALSLRTGVALAPPGR